MRVNNVDLLSNNFFKYNVYYTLFKLKSTNELMLDYNRQ